MAALLIFLGLVLGRGGKAAIAPISIGNPIFSPVIYTSTTGNLTYVSYSQWGSVWLGSANQDTNVPASALQPVGTYGLGVPLSPLGNNISRYDVYFDYHFRTYDDASHDVFAALITKGAFLWSGGKVMGGYTWGGLNRNGLETIDLQPALLQASVGVSPGADYYLNIVLNTSGDDSLPSWGRFSDTAIAAQVPEPDTLALLGLGLFGLAGWSRRKLQPRLISSIITCFFRISRQQNHPGGA